MRGAERIRKRAVDGENEGDFNAKQHLAHTYHDICKPEVTMAMIGWMGE